MSAIVPAVRLLTQGTGQAIATHTSHAANLIYQYTLRYFQLIQNIIFCGYGAKIIYFDGVKETKDISERDAFIQGLVKGFWGKIEQLNNAISKHCIHYGGLYLASGVFGTVSTLHYLSLVDLGKGLPYVEFLSNGFFFLANVLALHHHVKTYLAAKALFDSSEGEEKAVAKQWMKSAVFGILSSFSYAFMTALMLLTGPSALALIFGLVALSTGCLKILYDFLFLETAPRENFAAS